MDNANISLPVKKMKIGYTSLIISLSSLVLMLIVGLIVVLTEPFFGSYNFYLSNIFLFFGYMIVTPMYDFSRIVLLILYTVFIFLPLAALIVALISSRKKKKNWLFLVSLVVSAAMFSYYVYSIVNLVV